MHGDAGIADEIDAAYAQACRVGSDINEHLPVLRRYAERCTHVTEMGVRSARSTWAFLAARPGRLVSYDLCLHPDIDTALQAAARHGVDFRFIQADVLQVDIEPTDLLFIDTLHTYEQLKAELARHAPQVRRYIVCHDTVTYGYLGEVPDTNASELARSSCSGKGLLFAIYQFLARDTGWQVVEDLKNNNGLMVLARPAA